MRSGAQDNSYIYQLELRARTWLLFEALLVERWHGMSLASRSYRYQIEATPAFSHFFATEAVFQHKNAVKPQVATEKLSEERGTSPFQELRRYLLWMKIAESLRKPHRLMKNIFNRTGVVDNRKCKNRFSVRCSKGVLAFSLMTEGNQFKKETWLKRSLISIIYK